MTISQIGSTAYIKSLNAAPKVSVQKSLISTQTSQTSTTKKDTLFISEKAKDLAARQAGKEFQEEMNESFTAMLEEA
jgi:hypothetical protein